MEDFKVLKLFLFSIVNLLTYLLSIYFITSMYFTKSITFYFKNIKDLIDLINKKYNSLPDDKSKIELTKRIIKILIDQQQDIYILDSILYFFYVILYLCL